MENNIENARRIIALQCSRSVTEIKTEFSFQGVVCKVHGKPTKIVRLGLPTVVLLTPESTPQTMHVSGEAPDQFVVAVQELNDRGQVFYTSLQPGWALPDFLWTKA